MADPKLDAQFEEMGVETVRARLLEFENSVKVPAIAWLARKDQEERERRDSSQALQIRIARSANRAAWIAAIAAIIAAILAAISIALALK